MPCDYRNYPKNWKKIVAEIRARAGERCECAGECGLHDGRDIFFPERKRCEERNNKPGKWMRGKVVLTVAHLNAPGGQCSCEPKCGNPDHLKAMCQRCHLRYDIDRHAENRRRRRGNARRELEGKP